MEAPLRWPLAEVVGVPMLRSVAHWPWEAGEVVEVAGFANLKEVRVVPARLQRQVVRLQ